MNGSQSHSEVRSGVMCVSLAGLTSLGRVSSPWGPARKQSLTSWKRRHCSQGHYFLHVLSSSESRVSRRGCLLCPFCGCCLVTKSCLTLCDPVDCSIPGFPVHHHLLELAQTHVHRVGDAIQPAHLLSSPSPPAFNLSQHQGLFQQVNSSHQMAKVLEFQLQHQSFQWIFRTDFL